MKKSIIALLAVVAMAGCAEDTKFYDCGKESFTVTKSQIVSDKGVVIEREGDHYELQTFLGKAVYNVTEGQVKVSVGGFVAVNNCKVTEVK